MNKKILLIALFACFSTHGYAENTDPSAQACQKALASGDFTGAIAQAELASKSLPDNRDIYLCLGRAQGGAGFHTEAISALKTADKLSSTPFEHVIALTLIGNQYKSVKAYSEAILAYQQSLKIAQSDRNKRYEMIDLNLIGETLQASGDLKGALPLFEQALKLTANDNERADSYAHLASLHSAMGDHDQAIIEQIKTVVLEERSGDFDHYAHANLELCRIYLEGKQFANAEKGLAKLLSDAIQAGDSYWEASIYALQGRVKYAAGKPEEGLPLIDKAIALARKIGAEELAKEFEGAKNQVKM